MGGFVEGADLVKGLDCPPLLLIDTLLPYFQGGVFEFNGSQLDQISLVVDR